MKESYGEIKPILRPFSLVVTKKPIRAMGGSVKILQEGESSFYYVTGFPSAEAGLLVSPSAMISPAYRPDAEAVILILRLHEMYNGKVLRSGPGVDYIVFTDGTDWGTDKQHYRQQQRASPAALRELAAKIEEMSDAEAGEFLDTEAAKLSSLARADVRGAMTLGRGKRAEMQQWLIRIAQNGEIAVLRFKSDKGAGQ